MLQLTNIEDMQTEAAVGTRITSKFRIWHVSDSMDTNPKNPEQSFWFTVADEKGFMQVNYTGSDADKWHEEVKVHYDDAKDKDLVMELIDFEVMEYERAI